MKQYLILLAYLLVIQTEISAQNEEDRAFIIKQTNTKALNEIAKKATDFYMATLKKAVEQKVKMEIINSKNIKGYLAGFDKDGTPVYDFDDNINVAITGRIDKIWDGGSSGLNLNGAGIEIGHWEAGGLARSTHKELNGKITHDDDASVTSHATHTACTMIGTGIDTDARGMASSATIVSRKSDNDEAEIANFAAAGGILSSHSYYTGHPVDNTMLYGFYTENAKEWDEILYNAPYLTLCKSAGNTRNDDFNVGDNGYDLVFTIALAKNLITVGAVYSVNEYTGPESITQSAFSSWGPTDDWRIKPDIIANGVNVYSATNITDSAYSIKSGTSMAAPSVAGAVALLQQHYHNEHDVYMKSATVKALLLGTTDEAGTNDGPDFQNGWGLLNAERAAAVISNDGKTSSISELTLSNGDTFTTTIETDGNSPFALSIAWTDPSGNLVAGTDNQTPMLVNDLDVRLTNGTTTYKPWVMTPNATANNFTDAATKGDNFRDNVERIDIDSLPAGVYTVTVTHKGGLFSGGQDFSMVIRGIDISFAFPGYDDNSILVYPNPVVGDYLNILTPYQANQASYTVQIFDLLGRLRKSDTFHKKQIKLDISHLNAGLFFIKTRINNVDYEQSVIIHE